MALQAQLLFNKPVDHVGLKLHDYLEVSFPAVPKCNLQAPMHWHGYLSKLCLAETSPGRLLTIASHKHVDHSTPDRFGHHQQAAGAGAQVQLSAQPLRGGEASQILFARFPYAAVTTAVKPLQREAVM